MGLVGVDLVTLTLPTSSYVLSDFISHPWPPILVRYNVRSACDSWMTVDGGVMVRRNKLLLLLYAACYYTVPVFLPYPSLLSKVVGVYPSS